MEERKIFRKLNEHLKILQQHYPVENIFGIFVTKINEEDIETEAIVIPTFDKICTSLEPINEKIDKTQILDIRNVYQATKDGHPECITALDTSYIIINPKYEHLFQKIFLANKDKFRAGIANQTPAEELRIALMKICRHCWNESSNSVKFIKQITDSEKLALEGIIKVIGDEGTFSQAKVASAVGVSRLTMSNLIMKMKFNEVATVEYIGNKGTYVKFIDDTLLNIRGD